MFVDLNVACSTDLPLALCSCRYEQYGNESAGFRYYDEPREYVKASQFMYIHRTVYQFFAAAG